MPLPAGPIGDQGPGEAVAASPAAEAARGPAKLLFQMFFKRGEEDDRGTKLDEVGIQDVGTSYANFKRLLFLSRLCLPK